MRPDIEVEWLEHTGDAGFRLAAPDLPALFAAAAEQIAHLCCPGCEIAPRLERRLEAEGGDLVELLVAWLSEVNAAGQIHDELYAEFAIESLPEATALAAAPAAPLRLVAIARGEPIDPARHPLAGEIKAVTYHQAYVRREGERWRAQIIFDL